MQNEKNSQERLKSLDRLIEFALDEDLAHEGDVTSKAIFSDEVQKFQLISKDEGVFCGKEVIEKVLYRIDPSVKVEIFFEDGDSLKKGEIVAQLEGAVLNILQAERTMINFIGFLSGIASQTALLVKKASGKVRILDTRKTLPAYRLLSKYAVLCGGGENHRIGLYDMVMIKDNHIDAAGGITKAVEQVRALWKNQYKIEVETRNQAEVQEALNCHVDRIMLDNMSDEEMKKASDFIAKKAEVEASGNMNADRLLAVKESGVDFISFGSITHSVKSFDFSLKQMEKSCRCN